MNYIGLIAIMVFVFVLGELIALALFLFLLCCLVLAAFEWIGEKWISLITWYKSHRSTTNSSTPSTRGGGKTQSSSASTPGSYSED